MTQIVDDSVAAVTLLIAPHIEEGDENEDVTRGCDNATGLEEVLTMQCN